MEDSYRTISGESEGAYKDRGSKFLAFAFPVNSESATKKILSDIRKQHHSARHHCYAYKLGLNNNEYRINDDGEPSGTAGKPILGQILSHNLTNILIVVIRYFGGKLLGTSGLINAYRSAAEDAILRADIVTKYVECSIRIDFGYKRMKDIMNLINTYGGHISEKNFDERCRMKILIRKSLLNEFIKGFAIYKDICFEINENT